MSQADDDYEVKQVPLMQDEEQSESTIDASSEIEVPLTQLSGDEAAEKSFATTSLHNSMWNKKNNKLNMFLSGITIMKSMVGMGILGMPNIFKNFGVLGTILITIYVTINHHFTTYLLLKSKNLCKHSNYSTIGYYIFQHRWIIFFVNAIIILNNAGTSLGELIIFGTTCENLIKIARGDDSPTHFYFQRWFYTVLAGFIVFPLCLIKQIEQLRYVSLTAIISLLSFSIIVFYNFIVSYQDHGFGKGFGILPTDFDIRNALGAFPTIFFAFNWQFNCFPVLKGMAKPGDINLLKASLLGFSFAFCLYGTVGFLGYATYGNLVEADYLSIIDSKSVGIPLYVLLNVCFVISTTLSLPIMFFGARNNSIMLVKQFLQQQKKDKTADSIQKGLDDEQDQQNKAEYYNNMKKEKKKKEERLFVTVTACLLGILVIIAVLVTNLEFVFNLIGAIACNSIAIILPCLFYTKLVEMIKNKQFKTFAKKICYWFSKGYIIFGLILTVVCIISEFLEK